MAERSDEPMARCTDDPISQNLILPVDFFLTRISIRRMLRDNTLADSIEMKKPSRAARPLEKKG